MALLAVLGHVGPAGRAAAQQPSQHQAGEEALHRLSIFWVKEPRRVM